MNLIECVKQLSQSTMLRDNAGTIWDKDNLLEVLEKVDQLDDREYCIYGDEIRLINDDGYMVLNCEPVFWIVTVAN